MRPKCPKCTGLLMPDMIQDGRILSIKCTACGELISRDYKKRRAAPEEMPKRGEKVGHNMKTYRRGAHA